MDCDLEPHVPRLTEVEMRILRQILDGKSDREIAGLFHRSMRTIEVHRR